MQNAIQVRKTIFDKISKRYDFINNVISLNMHYFIKILAIKSLNIKPNSVILDLCCGSGDLGRIVKKLYPTTTVVGIDFSSNMLEIAQNKNKDIRYYLMDAVSLDFEDDLFDYVVMGFALRNIIDKHSALLEIKRILKEKGEFLHLDFGEKNFFNFIHNCFTLFVIKFFFKDIKPYKYLIASKNKFYNPKDLIEKIEKIGLNCLNVKNVLFNIISFQIFQK